MALSDVKVRSAKPEAKAYKLTDGEGMGAAFAFSASDVAAGCWRDSIGSTLDFIILPLA